MAFIHGKNTVVLFNATNLSPFFNDHSTSRSVETAETTAYGPAGAKTYIVGLEDGTVSVSGMFDGDTGAVDDILQGALAATTTPIVTTGPEGSAIGARVNLCLAHITSYDVTSPVADVVSVSAELQADGGIESGVSLQPITTAVSTTGTASAVDNTTSTTNGGVAHLSVIANTHDNTTTIKIQHSADNVVWTDLVTFTNVATLTTTQERVVVAAGTTVNRYLRASHTLAGSTGTVTYNASFARR